MIIGGVFGGVFGGLLEVASGGIILDGDVLEEIAGGFSLRLFCCSLIGSRITSVCKLFGGIGFELSSMFFSDSKKTIAQFIYDANFSKLMLAFAHFSVANEPKFIKILLRYVPLLEDFIDTNCSLFFSFSIFTTTFDGDFKSLQ